MKQTMFGWNRRRDDPLHLGPRLMELRHERGMSRAELARATGLKRRAIAGYERGAESVPPENLERLSAAYGVAVSALGAPAPDTTSDAAHQLGHDVAPEPLLREYVAMIAELRNLAPGTPLAFRDHDLTELANALGGTKESIERRLIELIGASPDDARHLREVIMSFRGSL